MKNLQLNKNSIRIIKKFLEGGEIPAKKLEWFYTEIHPYILVVQVSLNTDIRQMYKVYCSYKDKISKSHAAKSHAASFIYMIENMSDVIFYRKSIKELESDKAEMVRARKYRNIKAIDYMIEASKFLNMTAPMLYIKLLKPNKMSNYFKSYFDMISSATIKSREIYAGIKESYKKHSNAVSAMAAARQKSISIHNDETGETRHYFSYKDLKAEFSMSKTAFGSFISGKEVKKMKGWKIL